jgi:hypothetical protein
MQERKKGKILHNQDKHRLTTHTFPIIINRINALISFIFYLFLYFRSADDSVYFYLSL